MGSASRVVGAIAALVFMLALPALAREPLSGGQVRQAIIQDSISRYQGTGHPCACPFNLMRNGRQCGNVSAYRRPGGASPLCYAKDVSDGMVADWRRGHP